MKLQCVYDREKETVTVWLLRAGQMCLLRQHQQVRPPDVQAIVDDESAFASVHDDEEAIDMDYVEIAPSRQVLDHDSLLDRVCLTVAGWWSRLTDREAKSQAVVARAFPGFVKDIRPPSVSVDDPIKPTRD